MTDILDRIKHWASIQADGSQLGADLREAVTEIERLRGTAGAVSDGSGLAEIRVDIRNFPQSVTTTAPPL